MTNINALFTLTELALIRGVHDLAAVPVKKGRLKNLLEKLIREVDKQLIAGVSPTAEEINAVTAILDEFKAVSGWGCNNHKHVLTLISFVLDITDSRPDYGKIHHVLETIVDYFERAGNAPAACYAGGKRAAEHWRNITEKWVKRGSL